MSWWKFWKRDAPREGAPKDGALLNAAELYVVAESSDDANLQIRRLLEWRGAAQWTSKPVRVEIDANAETGTVAAVASV